MLEDEKQNAAARSLEFIAPGMRVGLGSGSTAAHMVALLGEKVRQGLDVVGVPTSEATRRLAENCGIPLTSLDETPELDVTIDGADEVDRRFFLIKGGGGALLREKVVAACSRRVVIIVDRRKWVDRVGAFPLPLEVVPFAWRPVADAVRRLGGAPHLRGADGSPTLTDQGNYILDCRFAAMHDPRALAAALNAIPGLVEHGLFIDLAHHVVIGDGADTRVLESPPG